MANIDRYLGVDFVKLKLFDRIRQQTIFSCVYELIVTSGQLFPVHGKLNNTVLK